MFKSGRRLVCFVMVGCLTAGAAGCDVFALISAAAKLSSGQIGDLTADELRVLSQAGADFINSQTPGAGAQPLTQAQAQAIADFLDANNVQSEMDLQNLIMQAQTDPGSVQGLVELAQAFQGSGDSFDANSPTEEELNALFNEVFNGGGMM